MKLNWTKQPDGSWTCGPVTVRYTAVGWGVFVADRFVSRPGGYWTARDAMRAAPRIKAVRGALNLDWLVRVEKARRLYQQAATASTGHLQAADRDPLLKEARALRSIAAALLRAADQLEAMEKS